MDFRSTELENWPELHEALCKVFRRDVPAHSAARIVPKRSVSHLQGSSVVTQRARIFPSATTSTA